MKVEKAFISVPMSGRKREDIEKDLARAREFLKNKGYDPVDAYHPD